MSVTVNDVLQLSSFKGAKVIAGNNGLDKVVTSVTVLEYANTTDEHNLIFESIPFIGGELVVTSFASAVKDIDAQLTNIKTLANVGEVGLAVYYVGIILPSIDQRIIDLCNELDFVLICMPENDPSLQYSSAISETMDMIVRDQMNSTNFALDIVEQISRLPHNQQTVDNLLAVTSNRIHASVAILNSEGSLLSAAVWPRNYSLTWNTIIGQVLSERYNRNQTSGYIQDIGWYYCKELKSALNRDLKLVIFSENGELETNMCQQSMEGIRLGLNLWGKDHEKVGREELLKAILQDEPIKMRRLGAIFNIDVGAINEAWIIHPLSDKNISRKTAEIRTLSGKYMDVCICESYENDVILMPIGTIGLSDVSEWADELKDMCMQDGIEVLLTRCVCLQTTSDVKDAYWDHKQYCMDAQVVFPCKKYLTLQEISFVKKCREIADKGEHNIEYYNFIIEQLSKGKDGEEILATLQTFLLDTNFSITETANRLFVHKNTVKYRLGKAGNILGFRIGEMPNSENVMVSMALMRLLK